MGVRSVVGVVFLSAAGLAAGLGAPACAAGDAALQRIQVAQQTGGYDRMAIPKPSDRRTGELEGWTDGDKNAKTPAAAGKAQKTATSAKPKSKAPERDPDDGGLPLPHSRDQDQGSPLSFDKNGNIGTGFKF